MVDLLPSLILSKNTSVTLGWTIATFAAGIISGIVAALLYGFQGT